MSLGILLFLILAIVGIVFVGVILFPNTNSTNGISWGGNEVAIIELDGPIKLKSDEGSIFSGGEVGVKEYIDLIDEAEKDNNIKAIVLKVNSPGGEVIASEKLANKVKEASEKKPVVSYIETIGASGAYMTVAPSTYIIAEKHSIVGSIGVIMDLIQYYELQKKIGINTTTIKAGKYKDIGSPNRPMTKEEKEILQNMTNEIYNDFVKWVSDNRNISLNRTYQIAQGKIYSGYDAQKVGLVDEVGTEDDAIKKAGELANISGKPATVELKVKSSNNLLFGVSLNDLVYSLGYGIGKGIALTNDKIISFS